MLTADTYQRPDRPARLRRRATTRLVLAAAARNPGRAHRRNDHRAKSADRIEITTPRRSVTRPAKRRPGGRRRRPHTSHRRPKKIKVEVLRWATSVIPDLARRALDAAGITVADLAASIPQAGFGAGLSYAAQVVTLP
ncbi:hypothetical protein ACFY36_45205 [Actinoplanes sp. NPDC000266]